MTWIFNDAGRKAAGYRGSADDCFVRAVVIAGQLDYQEVYDLVNEYGARERRSKKRKSKSSARTGVYTATAKRIIADLGWEWVATMGIGTGCTVHLLADELPKGRLVCNVSRHFVAAVDGLFHDTHDPTRGGTRCVYGYWTAS